MTDMDALQEPVLWQLETAFAASHFPLMRDASSSGPRKDLHGERRTEMTLEQLQRLSERINKRSRRKGPGGFDTGVPVDPRRPNTLSGGAAAPLEFD